MFTGTYPLCAKYDMAQAEGHLTLSVVSLAEAIKKEFTALGIPTVLEMAILSTKGKAIYSDLSKTAMDKISPFYQNLLIMSPGDNISLNLDPTRTIIVSRISDKAILIALTDKKVGILLTKMKDVSDKFGRLIDEFIAVEEKKTREESAVSQVPLAETSGPPPSASVVEENQSPPPLHIETREPVALPALQQPPTVSAPSIPAIVDRAVRIIDEAQKNNVTLRALGGVAVALRCPSARQAPLMREYTNINLIGHAKQTKGIKTVLTTLAFGPNKRFNALHGAKRLRFFDERGKVDVDIFLDVFEMCHKFDFRNRLELDKQTLSLADLIMTKLQIIELTEKDILDIIPIFLDHEAGKGDPEKMDVDYIAKLCSDDWGLWKTLTMTAQKVAESVDDYALKAEESQKIKSRLADFVRKLEDEEKSGAWKKRAKIGEKTKWYENVEGLNR